MYDCMIFDIDGTMTDSEKAVRLALAQLVKEEFGKVCPPEEIEFTFGRPGVESLQSLGFRNPAEADKRWAQLMLSHFDMVTLFDGIPEVLSALTSRGVKLGIVTSKNRYEYEHEFNEPYSEIASLFQTFVCASDTALHKPHPEPMLECLARMGVAPEQALYIGDTIADFQCADSAGVDFALATWGAGQRRDGIRAKYYPENPLQLLDL